jgi:hypothetical protein
LAGKERSGKVHIKKFWLLEDFVEIFQKGQNLARHEYYNGDESFDTYWRTLSLDVVSRGQSMGTLMDVDLDTHRRIVKGALLEPDNKKSGERPLNSFFVISVPLQEKNALLSHREVSPQWYHLRRQKETSFWYCSALVLLWLQEPYLDKETEMYFLRDTDSLAQCIFTASWMAR